MRYQLTSAQQHFTDEVREFLTQSLPADVAERVKYNRGIDKATQQQWTRTLNAKGWAAPNWPVAEGGTGWSLIERHIFDVECRAAHAPPDVGLWIQYGGAGHHQVRHARAETRVSPKNPQWRYVVVPRLQ